MVAQGHCGVNRICKLLGISKGTYYHCQNPEDRLNKKYFNIKGFVAKIIEDNPAYGILRIKAELKETYNTLIGKHTLGKLLKIWGLDLKRKVKSKKPSMIQKILDAIAGRANLLLRTKLTAPFMALSSDISVLTFGGGKA